MSLSKKEEEYINSLLSTNQQIVDQTLEEIRESGSSKLLPYIIDLLHVSDNEEIKVKANKILTELKQTDSVPIIMEAIHNEKYLQEQELLVRSCWENGLDFTPHLPDFIDLVVHGNYMTAFEAFTVIENLESNISVEETEKMISILQKGLSFASKEKQVLIRELIQLLPGLKME